MLEETAGWASRTLRVWEHGRPGHREPPARVRVRQDGAGLGAGRQQRAALSGLRRPEEDTSGKGEPCHPAELHSEEQEQRSPP